MAGIASKENGKKGGRPKGTKTTVTIAREKAREYLARRVEEEIQPIANKLIEKASTGDVPAIKELFDRAWGKPAQALEVSGKDGGAIVVDVDSIKTMSDEEINELLKKKINASS
jgi:hypothetical protein